MDRLRFLAGRHGVVDGLFVTGIVGWGIVEIWAADVPDNAEVRLTLGLLLSAVPVLFRRRYPLTAVVVVVAALPLSGDLYDETISIFAAMLTVLFAVARYADVRRAVAGFVLVLVAFGAGVAADGKPEDILFVAVIAGPIWAGGRLVRANKEKADAMADRAELAEREREERARAAVAEERSRIARELHDVVAHSISVMVVQAGAERRALADDPDRAETRDVLDTIEQTGRQTLAEMRRLLGMLRRSDDEIELAPQPGMEHVGALIDQVREAGLPVTLEVEGDAAPLPAGVDLSAYRIVQEALTNALKHAGPASARVTVRYAGDELELDIVDDGEGAVNGDGSGHGLIGMRERVTMFGGELAAGERSEGGYAVRARLPIAR